MTDTLPPPAQRVVDECIAEAWRNTEQGDATTEADVAADVAQWLYRRYRVHAYDDGEPGPLLAAAEGPKLGDHVTTRVYDHKGRVYKIHDECPEGPAWLMGQASPAMREFADGPWVSILVHEGGSVVMPIPLVDVVQPFPFQNPYASKYFRE